MSRATATPFDEPVPGWYSGTRHYRTPDGRVLAVIAHDHLDPAVATAALHETLDALAYSTGIHTVVVQPTVVIECNPDGSAEHLTPIASYPPGMSHEYALWQLGYVVTDT